MDAQTKGNVGVEPVADHADLAWRDAERVADVREHERRGLAHLRAPSAFESHCVALQDTRLRVFLVTRAVGFAQGPNGAI
eukprot:COSAG02_NODE_615_length_19511_cov_64.132701_4_plen_80_part_00